MKKKTNPNLYKQFTKNYVFLCGFPHHTPLGVEGNLEPS